MFCFINWPCKNAIIFTTRILLSGRVTILLSLPNNHNSRNKLSSFRTTKMYQCLHFVINDLNQLNGTTKTFVSMEKLTIDDLPIKKCIWWHNTKWIKINIGLFYICSKVISAFPINPRKEYFVDLLPASYNPPLQE